jgi:hypothetical protein
MATTVKMMATLPSLSAPRMYAIIPRKVPEGGHGDRVEVGGVPRDARGEDRADEAHEDGGHRHAPPD